MPEFTLHKSPDGITALEFEFFSPEEMQCYSPALTEVPDGYRLVAVKGQSKNKRPTLTVGPVKVGQPATFANSTVVPPQPPPAALEIPQVVMDAGPEQLELMAAKNGIQVDAKWKSRNLAYQRSSVASAMKKQNAR
jgi:hypothetical protein